MKIETIIGLLAGAFTTLSFVPQVIKVYKTKHAKDLSFVTFAFFAAGVLLWLIYGIMIGEVPVIVANSVTFFLILCIIVMMFRYKA